VFLIVLTSGIRKTIQAIKKMTLPKNVKTFLFIKLDAMKKMAHKTKRIQPAK